MALCDAILVKLSISKRNSTIGIASIANSIFAKTVILRP
jgi:hypothetical protein